VGHDVEAVFDPIRIRDDLVERIGEHRIPGPRTGISVSDRLPPCWPVNVFDLAPLTAEQSDELVMALDPTLRKVTTGWLRAQFLTPYP
jgi:hypothetical protein